MRQLCILHANCQGEALKPLLEASPDFTRHFEIRQYLNYTRQEVANSDLERCSLFLHQYLAPKWGSLSTGQMLDRLPANANAICLPNYFFKGYWPFWTNSTDVIKFADSILEGMLQKGLNAQEILTLYMRGNLLPQNLEEEAQASLAREREKEAHSPIKYSRLLDELWREKQLFITVNHPSSFLIVHTAQNVLSLLGLPPLSDSAINNYQHPQGEFELPIHPHVAKQLKLPFAGPERKYKCFGQELSFQEYISVYLACRQEGISDLTGMLLTLASRA